jgi:hypothetical protein
VYPSANDFGKSTSFTIAFWMKKKAHKNNAQFAFALATGTDIWTKADIFMLIENKDQSSVTHSQRNSIFWISGLNSVKTVA